MSPSVARGGGRRIGAVQAPVVPIVADLVRAHPGTISLAQGVVGYGPPAAALAALAGWGEAPADHLYGPVAGEPELRAAFASKLARENGIDCDASDYRVVVTAGANMGFLAALLAVTDPGDEVILPVPYYFNHEMAIRMVDCVPVPVATTTGFQLDPGTVAAALTPRTRAVVTVSPNNPSGAIYLREALAAVNTLCREAGIWHVSDEAYEYFAFGPTPVTAVAALPGAQAHTIALYSLSKGYGFAGWRIGFMVLPGHLHEAVLKVQDTNLICATRVAQRAAVAVLGTDPDWRAARLATIAAVRGPVLAALGALAPALRPVANDGAFYVLGRVATDLPDLELVRRLVVDFGVATLPGSAFGLTQGCHLRISYGALQPDTAAEGLGRLARGIAALT